MLLAIKIDGISLKLWTFLHWMTTLRQRKKKPDWEKMFIIHVYNKQFGSRIPHKSIVTIHNQRVNWGKEFSRHFTKEIIGSCETKIMSDSGNLVLIVQIGIVFEPSRISPEKQSNQNSATQNT